MKGNKDVTNIDTDFDAYLAKAFQWPQTPAERRQALERARPETRASLERAYAVRVDFGLWNECDPIANAIIELAEAQNLVTEAINLDAETGDGEIAPAAVVRFRAIINLVDALAEAVAERITGAAELNHNALKLASKLMASVDHFNNIIAERQ
jgi:hypothetical protein